MDIAIVPSALTDLAFSRLKRSSVAAQRTVRETLLAHGSLVFASDAEIGEFIAAIKKSPLLLSPERDRWLNFLTLLNQQKRLLPNFLPSGFKLCDLNSESDLAGLNGTGEKVLVLSEDQFDRVFPNNPDAVEEIRAEISATTSGGLGEVSVIDSKRALAVAGAHAQGTDREHVWNELFAPLARRSKGVSVLDRYMFSELARRDSGIHSRYPPEHLIWLLNHLAATSPVGTRVRLVGGFGDERRVPEEATQLLDLILRQWNASPGGIIELEVTLANWRVNTDLPHNRHIRFGSLGYTLAEGLDRLRSPRLWDEDGLNWTYKWDFESTQMLANRETRVEQSSTVSSMRRTLP
ncbi:hypothetical protein E3T27_04675 [Cryobacterium lyxosi]|uniref:Uncharacterized protein n=1 Tax=Cryobacterium lyxosi TaxID=1259228 RepID=A0A4R8ZJD7_9MICO|nr:hypothetical protein E3T27_04675 [Cryobacterium lyxosi]